MAIYEPIIGITSTPIGGGSGSQTTQFANLTEAAAFLAQVRAGTVTVPNGYRISILNEPCERSVTIVSPLTNSHIAKITLGAATLTMGAAGPDGSRPVLFGAYSPAAADGIVGDIFCRTDRQTLQKKTSPTTWSTPVVGYLGAFGVKQTVVPADLNALVIAYGGQSNADGRGAVVPVQAAQGVWLLRKDNVVVRASEPAAIQLPGWTNNTPVGVGAGPPGFSSAVTLANRLKAVTGQDVILVPCAIGSTNLTHWADGWDDEPASDTTLFGQMRNRVLYACNGDISRVAFVWVGHESEAPGAETGIAGKALLYGTLVEHIRVYFPRSPVFLVQNGSVGAAGAGGTTDQLLRWGGEAQRRCDADYGDKVAVGTLGTSPSIIPPNTANGIGPTWGTFGALDAQHAVTPIANGVRFLKSVNTDNTVGLVFWLTLQNTQTYRIRFSVAGSGTLKFASPTGGNGTTTLIRTDTSAAITLGNPLVLSATPIPLEANITVTATGQIFQIQRNAATDIIDANLTDFLIDELIYPYRPVFDTSETTAWIAENLPGTAAGSISYADNDTFTAQGDGSLGSQISWTPENGRKYRIEFDYTNVAGAIKLSVVGTTPLITRLGTPNQSVASTGITASGTYRVEFTGNGSPFRFQRDTGGVPFEWTVSVRRYELATPAYSGVYLIPSWDLRRNAPPDDIHYHADGQRALGNRLADVFAGRYLGLAGHRSVNGNLYQGPLYLISAAFTDGTRTAVRVVFNARVGAAGAVADWAVQLGTTAQAISTAAIDGGNPNAVILTLSAAVAAGAAFVSLGVSPGVTDGSARTGITVSDSGEPAVRFDRVAIA